jgi:hypothetical protein
MSSDVRDGINHVVILHIPIENVNQEVTNVAIVSVDQKGYIIISKVDGIDTAKPIPPNS